MKWQRNERTRRLLGICIAYDLRKLIEEVGAPVGIGGKRRGRQPSLCQHGLQHEGLVPAEPLAGRGVVLARLGPVHPPERLTQGRQLEPDPGVERDRVLEVVGHCRVGDVLGIVEGDVVEIGDSVEDVAVRVLERLLSSGGELVTLVRGDEADDAAAAAITRRLRRTHHGVEVMVYDGGQPFWPLILGVE